MLVNCFLVTGLPLTQGNSGNFQIVEKLWEIQVDSRKLIENLRETRETQGNFKIKKISGSFSCI